MSEQPEDAKPKLNLVISLLESRTSSPSAVLIHNLNPRAYRDYCQSEGEHAVQKDL